MSKKFFLLFALLCVASLGYADELSLNPDRPERYIVQKGDTLFSISRLFGTTVEAIKSLNNLSSDLISPGQRLKIF